MSAKGFPCSRRNSSIVSTVSSSKPCVTSGNRKVGDLREKVLQEVALQHRNAAHVNQIASHLVPASSTSVQSHFPCDEAPGTWWLC